jgi:RimJ/RimL family protein N-acetyltransferase
MLASLRQIPRVRRALEELRPGAILLTHEGIRTSWLVAARSVGIPTFAIQHGVIYPTHPGYAHPRDPRLLLPTRTFVFGDGERRVLLEHGGYRADEVVVSGSPRLDLDAPAEDDPEARRAERAAVRRELGVAPTDRMLAVSTVFLEFSRRFYYAHLLDRLLGGPLPGVHVVLKLHPGETDEGPYREELAGLARARGYPPPKVTVVRDIDLYRLLRAADAHLGLNSTVLTDAVIVGTPNLISIAQAYRDPLGYIEAGVARPVRDIADLRTALDDPRPADPTERRAFVEAHFRPGDAAGRIVLAVLHPVVSLRPAGPADAALLLEWANDPAARRASGDRATIEPTTHAAWFATRLADPSTYRIWIGQTGDGPVGVVRFERLDERSVEVSIEVAPEARGRGLSHALLAAGLEAARQDFDRPSVVARVRPDNERSVRLFERAGFSAVRTSDGRGTDQLRLELRP